MRSKITCLNTFESSRFEPLRLSRVLLRKSRLILSLTFLLIGPLGLLHAASLPTGFGPCQGPNCPSAYLTAGGNCAAKQSVGDFRTGIIGYDEAYSVFIGGNLSTTISAELEGVGLIGGDFTMSRPPPNGYNVGVAGFGSCVSAPSGSLDSGSTPPSGSSHLIVGGNTTTPTGQPVIVGPRSFGFNNTGIPAGISPLNVVSGDVETANSAAAGVTYSLCPECAVVPVANPNLQTLIDDTFSELDTISQCIDDFDTSTPGDTIYAGVISGSATAITLDCTETKVGGLCPAGTYIFEDTSNFRFGTSVTIANINMNAFPIDGSATLIINSNASGVVNVRGQVIDPPGGNSGGFHADHARHTLWNYPNASQVNFLTLYQHDGSVLIPNGGADFAGSGHNGRFIVSGNVTHTGGGSEFHNFDFIGEVPDSCSTPPAAARDYGDLPDTASGVGTGNYNTLLSDNGASHLVDTTASYLGSCVDTEGGTLQNGAANADDGNTGVTTLGTCAVAGDDEDGVILPASLTAGANESVSLIAPSGSECVMEGWIDFNQNGDLSDAGEKVIGPIQQVAGTTAYTVAVPAGATAGSTYSRFRCTHNTPAGAGGPNGPAGIGEVEDYPVTIAATPQPPVQSCPADTGRIIKNGYAVVACKPGVAGSGITSTLAVKDILGIGTLHDDSSNHAPGAIQDVPTIREWDTGDFDIGGVGPQEVLSHAIDNDNGDIFTGSTRMYGDILNVADGAGFISAGPAIVYKIDGVSGAVSVLVNLTTLPQNNTPIADLDRIENMGIGYIDYNNDRDELYVVGMGTGSIYRIDATTGAVLQTYNPDLDASVPELPVRSDPPGSPSLVRVNDTLAMNGERLFGVAYNPVDNRVYYSVWRGDRSAVAGVRIGLNRVRSVGLDSMGAIDITDDIIELTTPEFSAPNLVPPPSGYNMPIGDIEFSLDGANMLLAEVGYDSGDPNFVAVLANFAPRSVPHEARVLQYQKNMSGAWIAEPVGKFRTGDFTAPNGGPFATNQGANARGGVDFAYHDVGTNVVNGIEDYMLATSDVLNFISAYGFQYTPIGGGTIAESIGIRLTEPTDSTLAKGLFGDVDVLSCPSDYGDAPDTGAGSGTGNYNTQNNTQGDTRDSANPADFTLVTSDNGPSHMLGVLNAPYLGGCVDADDGTQQNPAADEDDSIDGGTDFGACTSQVDEDGVAMPSLLVIDQQATIPVTVGSANACMLNAWIDYNANGDFTDSGEQIASNQMIAGTSTVNLTPTIPSTVTAGDTYARFRCTSANFSGGPVGPAPDGEVEDYLVTLGAAPTTGTIIVQKLTLPASTQDFSFVSPSLTPTSFAIASGEMQTFNDVDAGSYTITETPGSSHTATISCIGDSDGGNSISSPAVTVDLDVDETITCTFTNTANPVSARVTKSVSGAGGSQAWSFDFTLTTSGTAPTLSSPNLETTGTGSITSTDVVSWSGLVPGQEYVLSEAAETGFTQGALTCAGIADTDGSTTDASITFIAPLSSSAPFEIDCAISNAAEQVAIGNLVWMDNGLGNGTANDGIRQSDELGVGGVRVELYPSSVTDPETTTAPFFTVTDSNGLYVLSAPPGQYFVHIPASQFDDGAALDDKISTTGQGAADNVIDDNATGGDDGDDIESNGVSSLVYNLQANDEPAAEAGTPFAAPTTSPVDNNNTNSTADFGFYQLVSIGNKVWMDNGAGTGGIANDGIQNGTEAGVEDVDVVLYASGVAVGGTATATTMTEADGTYVFNNIVPGDYYVHLPASNFLAGGELLRKISTTGSDAANADTDEGGSVNSDNGIDVADPSISGISSAVYEFAGGAEPDAGADVGDADDNSDVASSVARPSADDDSTNFTIDFGVYEPVSIGNLVFMDNGAGTGGVANDGIQNGTEMGVGGVTVELYQETQLTSTTAFRTATTDASDGTYVFDSVPPGNYFVFIPAANFATGGTPGPLVDKISTTDPDTPNVDADHNGAVNSDDGIDVADPTMTGVRSALYTVTANGEPSNDLGDADDDSDAADSEARSSERDSSTNYSIDFAFYQPVAIGNLVWMDNGTGTGGVANDGIRQAGESGIEDVTVELYPSSVTDPESATPVDTTQTDLNGLYVLSAPPGEYFVHIPASQFDDGEALDEKVSSTGQGAADNEVDDNATGGDDGDDIESNGVSSLVYNLQANDEPTTEAGTPFATPTTSPVDNNNTNSTADFGFYQLVSIGNKVWMDNGAGTGGVANDGIQNGTEAGVEDVDVVLYASGVAVGGMATATTMTETDGTYVFNNIVPGDYYVHLSASNFVSSGELFRKISTTGADAANVDTDQGGSANSDNGIDVADPSMSGVSSNVYSFIGGGEPDTTADVGDADDDSDSASSVARPNADDNNTNFTIDFGVYEPVSIGNLVFMDNGAGTGGVANDGIQNGMELGVPLVTVELYRSGQAVTTTAFRSMMTQSDGTYVFDSVPPGDYFVHIPAANFAAGVTPGPLVDKVSSAGQDTANADEDHNGSANSDDGDDPTTPAMSGVSSLVYSVTADQEPTNDLGDADDDSDASSSDAQSSERDSSTNYSIDFAFYQPVSIGNLVWMDNGVGNGTPNDGIKQSGESGIEDVVVELHASTVTDPESATPISSTTTDLNGLYVLTAPPGEYFVHIPASEFGDNEPLDEKISTTGQGAADNEIDDNATGGDDGDDIESNGVSSRVYNLQPNDEPTGEAGAMFVAPTLSPSDDNNTNSTADFGFYQLVSLGNLVWMDNGAGGGIPNDGIKQANEMGIPNVTVELYPSSVGNPAMATATRTLSTESDGSFYFNDLIPGEYFVHIPISQFAEDAPLEGKQSTLGQGSADNSNDDNAGEDGDDVETDGVSTRVYDLLGGDEPTLEAGFDGVAVSTQDDNNTNSTADLGFLVPVSIGSLVWDDLNADGMQASNEPPVANAVITLEIETLTGFEQARYLDNSLVTAQTTQANGLYRISDLPPANYRVTIVPPSNLVASPEQTIVENDDEGDSNIATTVAGSSQSPVFSLASGLEPVETQAFRGDEQDSDTDSPDDRSGNMTIDFGFVRLASIGDYVWLDLDADGVQDANEDGIANVRVKLIPPSTVDIGAGIGAEIDGTTDQNGGYLFRDLPPFTSSDLTEGYIVMVDDATLPDGLEQTYDEGPNGSVGTLDHMSDPIQLIPEQAHLTADFGYVPELGALGDRVWVDADGDGMQDPGEPGIPGVTVSLRPPLDIDLDNGNGMPITDVTDSNGNYYFPDLPLNESYIVTVVDRETVAPQYSKLANGDPDVRDSNATEHDDESTVTITTAEKINLDADFGYLPMLK